MLIDTHCHLDAAEFDRDRDAVIARSRSAGVRAVVLPAVHASNFDTVRTLAASFDGGCYALGIHPLYVDGSTDDDLTRLRETAQACLADPRFVAIGEIGLDHFVPGLDRGRQQRFLDAQLRIARDLDLPVLLHVRRSQDPVLASLRRFGAKGIAHAFNGSPQQAQAYLAQGCVLGFGGAMTFTRALRIRRLAAELPDEAHVLETDAPDISPEWLHPGRNEPGEVARIAEVFAALRGRAPAEVAAITATNAMRALPRLAACCDATVTLAARTSDRN